MATGISSPTLAQEAKPSATSAVLLAELRSTVLTGGFDRPYAYGLTMALVAQGIAPDVIGNDAVDGPEMHNTPGLRFFGIHPNGGEANLLNKLMAISKFYLKLFRYAATTRSRVFHILWNNKVPVFDRTLLMLYYRLLGKRIVLTAHNVNAGKRDGNDSFVNRGTLRIQYQLAEHIFVHTNRMKAELLDEFGVSEGKVTVIPFGINNSVPNTELTPEQAKQALGIGPGTKTVLFFGAIRPYKGLEYLVDAFLKIAERNPEYRLVIVGAAKKGCEDYLAKILERIESHPRRDCVILRTHFVPDSDTELYFKAADVVALPYREIFQSGVLFLSYSFGVPVIASDIGSFRDDVVEGENGFFYDLNDAEGLERAIEKYFSSNLFRELGSRREGIRVAAEEAHSWETVGKITRSVYESVLAQ